MLRDYAMLGSLGSKRPDLEKCYARVLPSLYYPKSIRAQMSCLSEVFFGPYLRVGLV